MMQCLWAFALSLFVLLAQPCWAANEAASAVPIKDKWALIVGISEFANPALNLKYAAKDATDFRDFLVRDCNFAADHVHLVTNKEATSDRILDELGDSWLPRVAGPDDLVVIFISSHGSPSDMDVRGVNYVIAHNTNPEKLFTTGIQLQHLADTIKERVRSNRVIVVLDACHSGAASGDAKGLVRPANVDADKFASGIGQLVICSSSKNESSWESKQYQNSVFTRTLIDSLKKNGPNTKLGVALTHLKEEVPRQVQAERGATQTPVVSNAKWSGDDIVLACVPTAPHPAPKIAITTAVPEVVSNTSIASSSASAPPVVASSKSPTGIPKIAGKWLGCNGVTYNIWQKGRATGWDMPEYNEYGRGLISEDGKINDGYWYGPITGHGKSQLEVDENNVVIRMVAEDGCVFTRVEH